jgi:ATP-dependent Lhr-like helicase
VLLAPLKKEGIIVKALLNKQIKVIPIIPNEIEKYPWAGHLGIKMVKILFQLLNKAIPL